MSANDIIRIIATDCGSTTTKAILIEKVGNEYRQTCRGEAPTTVEAPAENVTVGVRNSIQELEELSGIQMLDENGNIIKGIQDKDGKRIGVDKYISTSSAGGGLQMMVGGVVKSMSAESASRAALGGGAIVMEVIATNDGRLPHERIELIRNLRPDMILLSGGVDGGTIKHVAEIAEIIAAADPRPRLGSSYELPIIYAGNVKAQKNIRDALEKKVHLIITENIRPSLEKENLHPARQKIQDLFEEHVMAQAPGYKELMALTDISIMPTPAAVGSIIRRIAEKENIDILGADIGGATTDVFSVFQELFNRSVSANLGMSYSISNVLAEAGLENIMRWVPVDMDEKDLRNRVKNKMIRPTTIPQLLEELMFEQAVCREALRLSLEQHKLLAVGLKGVQKQRSISDAFSQDSSGDTLVNMKTCGMILGSGGVLSHAPRRIQTAMMMIDGFLPEGFTELAVDSIFMTPHLGVLSEFHPQAAGEVFEKDCLVRIATCIAPIGPGKEGKKVGTLIMEYDDKKKKQKVRETLDICYGEIYLLPLGVGEFAEVEAIPEKGFDMGEGKNETVKRTIQGGLAGVLIDARGRRPFEMPKDKNKRIECLCKWFKTVGMYPEF